MKRDDILVRKERGERLKRRRGKMRKRKQR